MQIVRLPELKYITVRGSTVLKSKCMFTLWSRYGLFLTCRENKRGQICTCISIHLYKDFLCLYYGTQTYLSYQRVADADAKRSIRLPAHNRLTKLPSPVDGAVSRHILILPMIICLAWLPQIWVYDPKSQVHACTQTPPSVLLQAWKASITV